MRATRRCADAATPQRLPEDIDLEQRIASFLHQKQVPEAQGLRADAHLGTVVMIGQLPSHHAKWLCLECCRHVAGVIKLVDQVVVQTEEGVCAAEPQILKWRARRPMSGVARVGLRRVSA